MSQADRSQFDPKAEAEARGVSAADPQRKVLDLVQALEDSLAAAKEAARKKRLEDSALAEAEAYHHSSK